jgi:monosaccharide-transporting ATPase
MSEPTIELVDIYKSFGSTRVLEGVSLPLFPGEVHSLMGENGAGKSTLVKIMAGLHQPDKGTVPRRWTGSSFSFNSAGATGRSLCYLPGANSVSRSFHCGKRVHASAAEDRLRLDRLC